MNSASLAPLLTSDPFVTTHWSMVVACGQAGSQISLETSQAALTELCRDYWPPLYGFIRRRGYELHDAQDLTQGFFAELIESRAYASADPAKGKFRAYLLALLKHFLASSYEHDHRQKRAGGRPFIVLDQDLARAEAAYTQDLTTGAPADEERLFEWSWASALVRRALANLSNEYQASEKAALFTGLRPLVTGGVQLPSQEELAKKFGMPVETLRSYLSRMRQRYRDFLRAEVARTVAVEAEVDEELAYLYRILISGS